MRFYKNPDHRFYAGVDLHARSLFLVVLDPQGQIRYARNLPANPQAFRKAIAPFRDGLVVGCECMHCWYWLADTCRDDHIAFVLGHAWAMAAVHGSKTISRRCRTARTTGAAPPRWAFANAISRRFPASSSTSSTGSSISSRAVVRRTRASSIYFLYHSALISI